MRSNSSLARSHSQTKASLVNHFQLTPLDLPSKIDIEPTINCNFECVMCQRTYWTRRAPDMTLEQFRHVYASFPNLERVKIQGIGEPLLNHDLFDMIAHAKKNGAFVMTYTNGSVLHLRDNAQQLINSGIDLIRVSIDSGTRETFQAIRVKSDFYQIVRNVALIRRLRGVIPTPRIEFWVVGMTYNLSELPRILGIAQQTGVDVVRVQLVMNTFDYRKEINDKLTYLQLSQNPEAANSLAHHIEYAREKGVQLELEATKAYSEQRKCHWAFDSAFISVEGYVVPCCTIADPRVINMGNIFEEAFEVIWTGARYQRFRRTILEHQLLSPCQNCYADSHKHVIPQISKQI